MLTDAKLRALKPAEKPFKVSDAHRLYVYVTPNGSKLWRMNYVYLGKNKCLSFGPYPEVGLADARAARDEARSELREGRDPAVLKQLKAQARIDAAACTFEKMAREWHEMAKAQWAPKHAYDVLHSFERDIFKHIGGVPIGSLTTVRVLEVLRQIERRPAIETAKRVRQRMSAVFAYAIACGIDTENPAEKVVGALKPMPRKGRQPAITSINLLRKLLADAESDPAHPVTLLALRLLALTVVRPGELRYATWQEFEDLDGLHPLWRIPSDRMKGDLERKGEWDGDHLVPLSRQAVQVIEVLRTLTGTAAYVFPSTRSLHKPMSENAIGYLLNRAGYHGRHVPHGWRAAFSTIMNEWAKVSGRADDREVIDLMLAHVPRNKVEGAYNRAAYMPRRRELAAIWADMLMKGLPDADTLIAVRRRGAVRAKRLFGNGGGMMLDDPASV